MTIEEAAKHLNTDETTIREWIREKKLNAVLIDGKYDIHTESLSHIDDQCVDENLIELECMLNQSTEMNRRIDNQKAVISDQRATIKKLEFQLAEKGKIHKKIKKSPSIHASRLVRATVIVLVLIALIISISFWLSYSSVPGSEMDIAGSIMNKSVSVNIRDNNGPISEDQQTTCNPISVIPPGISEAYNQAVEDFEFGKYDSAMEKFRWILGYPSYHDFKDNAQYCLAECHFAKGEYNEALVEFRKVKLNFPGGNKTFDSEVMIAYTYCRLGRVKQARFKLCQLSLDFPNEGHQSSISDLSERIRSMEAQRKMGGGRSRKGEA